MQPRKRRTERRAGFVSLGVLDFSRAEALLRLLLWRSLRVPFLAGIDPDRRQIGHQSTRRSGAGNAGCAGTDGPYLCRTAWQYILSDVRQQVFSAACNDKQLPSNSSDKSYEECSPAPLRVKCPSIRTLWCRHGQAKLCRRCRSGKEARYLSSG